MNFPAKVIAAVMVVTLTAVAFQSSRPAPVAAQAEAEATATQLVLSGVLSGLGKGAGTQVSEYATQWGLGMLGFNPGGNTSDIDPELDAIEQTLNEILAAQQQISADLNNLACDTWTTAILDNIANIDANWNNYQTITTATAAGKTSNITPGFVSDVLGANETALGIQTDLETIYDAVFPSAGTGVVDACLAAAALNDPPASYELDSIWYDEYVVPFQNSLMLEYTRAMSMVVNAYHQKALLAAQANGMPAGDFSTLAGQICSGEWDGDDPSSTSKPSSYCDTADSFVSTHLIELRKIVARGGTSYTDDKVALYTSTGYLLPRSLSQYGGSTVGAYDDRLANSSGYDNYTGTWAAAPVKLFKEILTGWKDLGGKSTTTAAYFLCHGTGDTSVSGEACTGLSGLDKLIVIFPETGKSGHLGDTKYVCFMDGSIPRDKVDGQPFCSDNGFELSNVFHSHGNCDGQAAYKQHTWTQSLASGDPSFYTLSYDYNNLNPAWCTKPGFVDLTIEKPRWPSFDMSQIVCTGGFPATNPAGLPTKCGDDLTEWLDATVPLAATD